MPRAKFQTLTEPMFYILLSLREECCGTDVMDRVTALTGGRVTLGPGTLYHLLEEFCQAGMITELSVSGRRRNYRLTDKGREALEAEYRRLRTQVEDYNRLLGEEETL